MGQTQEWHKVHFWFQRARHKNCPGFILVPKSQTQEWLCFQWARHTNDPSSFWFQRARHRNGSLTYKYIYIYICLQAAHAGAHGQQKAGTFSVPDTRLFVGHSLVTGRVAPCRLEVLHLFRWSTHTPCRSMADEMKMKMK